MDQFTQTFAVYTPRISGALTILIAGVVLALVARRGTTRALSRLQFDQISDRIGLTAVLRQGGTQRSTSNIVGVILFYAVLVLAFVAALGPLGFGVLATRLDQILVFVPRVLAAIFVLIIGVSASGLLADLAQQVLEQVGVARTGLLATVVRVCIITIAAILAGALLNVNVALFINIIVIILGGIVATAVLAVGLGVRPLSQNVAASRYVAEGIAEGDTITIAGYSGTVERIGYAQTVIRSDDGRTYIIPHTYFMEHVVQREATSMDGLDGHG